MFSSAVCTRLNYYVYRLIDPRNGETFYIGKGKDNRVFTHAKGLPGEESDEDSDKLVRIREIQNAGFEVSHVIHRHGRDEKTALEVEAALIDAYPEVTNEVAGHGSDERGMMHAREIIEQYEAPPAVFQHPVVLITINRTATERESIYEAVRYAWKLSPKKAGKTDYVLAIQQGLIIGVFIADKWLEACPESFPGTSKAREGRWGFVGREAPRSIQDFYLRKRIPDAMRKKGAANPVRYGGP